MLFHEILQEGLCVHTGGQDDGRLLGFALFLEFRKGLNGLLVGSWKLRDALEMVVLSSVWLKSVLLNHDLIL